LSTTSISCHILGLLGGEIYGDKKGGHLKNLFTMDLSSSTISSWFCSRSLFFTFGENSLKFL
jgi:hypothetical protein